MLSDLIACDADRTRIITPTHASFNIDISLLKLACVPIAKPRMTRSDKWQQRDCVMRYRSYCDQLRAAWGDREVPDRLDIRFLLPMPASWSQKKRDRLCGQPHQSKPDIDNLLKGFMDALLKDDARIWEVRASKIWSVDGGIEIWMPVP